jgi:hypothetical protein
LRWTVRLTTCGSLAVHTPGRGDLRRVRLLPVRPRQRHADGPAFLGIRSCPPVAHDPRHERTAGRGVHSLPSRAVSTSAHTSQVGEQGRRRGTRSGLNGRGGLLGSKEECPSTGTGALQATLLGEAAAEPGTPRRLGEVVGVIHVATVSRVPPLASRRRAGAETARGDRWIGLAAGRRRSPWPTRSACGRCSTGADASLVLPTHPCLRRGRSFCAKRSAGRARWACPRTDANRMPGGPRSTQGGPLAPEYSLDGFSSRERPA